MNHPQMAPLIRLKGLIYKEIIQIFRDPSSLAIAFLMPVILLLLFGYGVSLDAKQIPIGFVSAQFNQQSLSLEQSFLHSTYYHVHSYPTMTEAENALITRHISGIVHLSNNFGRQFLSNDHATIQVLLNGIDSNQATIIKNYISGTIGNWILKYNQLHDQVTFSPVSIEDRIWFNANAQSRYFLIPGLIAIIMTLIGALLTALVMAREWERGTLESLMVTPIKIHEILLGKLIPYFILGMGGMVVSVAIARWLFMIPLRGSIGALFAASALFMLTMLGMGLLISIMARQQFFAALVAILTTFLPAFMLSGFIFWIPSMPNWLQWLTHLVAARYFVAILQSLFLAGNIWPVILPNLLALTIMAIIFLVAARIKLTKRIE